MPTLVQQTIAGVTNANTFALVTDLDTYADNRGKSLPAATDDKERLLIQANDFLTSLEGRFKGHRTYEDQPVVFPRDNISAFGYYISGEIPQAILDAQCQLALDIHGGLDLLANSDGKEVVEEKVASLSVKYKASGTTSPQPVPSKALAFLEPYFKKTSGNARILR